jgi:hypothetical protein
MASFTAGTTFTDGVANDVTAAKLGALVTNAIPTSGFIQDRTAETVVAVNDTLLIGDASDSNNLKRMTVANLLKAPLVSTSGTIDVLTTGTTTSTAEIVTSGTIATLNSTTGTIATLNSTTGTITTALIPTGTFGTTTSTASTITTGTIPTLVATTLITTGTGTAAAPAIVPTGDTNTGIFFPAAETIAATTNGTERLRITSGGDLCVGDTAAGNQNSNSLSFDKTNGRGYVNHVNGTASGTIYWNFALNGTGIGSITQNGTTAVAYNTSSDYRLKTNLEQISNGIDRLKQLPVYRFNWIADESGNKVDGFVAHEAQAIVPECITGEKDAVDADGKPIYQGIDQSKIVPLLTAALKEAIAEIEILKTKVASLEAA